jgi:hypothetical protein
MPACTGFRPRGSSFGCAYLPVRAVLGSPSYMAGLILRERFIADRSRTISGPARQSGCAAWSFDFTLRLSAKHLSKLATYFDSFRSTCRRYRHIPNDMSKSSKYFGLGRRLRYIRRQAPSEGRDACTESRGPAFRRSGRQFFPVPEDTSKPSAAWRSRPPPEIGSCNRAGRK